MGAMSEGKCEFFWQQHPYGGATPCVLPAGHRGKHQSQRDVDSAPAAPVKTARVRIKKCDYWTGTYGGKTPCILPMGHHGDHRYTTDAQDAAEAKDQHIAKLAAAFAARALSDHQPQTDEAALSFDEPDRGRFLHHMQQIILALWDDAGITP